MRAAAKRVLMSKLALGLFDAPPVDATAALVLEVLLLGLGKTEDTLIRGFEQVGQAFGPERARRTGSGEPEPSPTPRCRTPPTVCVGDG